jgi:hypothetical protein
VGGDEEKRASKFEIKYEIRGLKFSSCMGPQKALVMRGMYGYQKRCSSFKCLYLYTVLAALVLISQY